MTTKTPPAPRAPKLNVIGLEQNDYKGAPSTLCPGCGHDSISSRIISVCFDLGIQPHRVAKFSGIGCSSKTPAYFLNRAHGFNSVHGRMPSVATGAILANRDLVGLGVSGDGDTGSIGFGQFKHMVRRNVPMVYIVENNGVYGLTKGQFSATADIGQQLKYAGLNELPPIDLCAEAILGGCTYVARSFAGDPKQIEALLKGAFSHRGLAVIDIISPCVTFNNNDQSTKSYGYGKEHEERLHDLTYIKPREEITVEYAEGEAKQVAMHDGSTIMLKKLEQEYDPTSRTAALMRLEEARAKQEFITGLIYVNPEGSPTIHDMVHASDEPLARLPEHKLRPTREALAKVIEDLM
ncbi:MAG TPA: 2-oxoacid:ferredoxin oxidoreductase subunit beta [Herpetosiphonaceae bacterium]